MFKTVWIKNFVIKIFNLMEQNCKNFVFFIFQRLPHYSCWYKLMHGTIFSDEILESTIKLMLGTVKLASSKFQDNMECNNALIVKN